MASEKISSSIGPIHLQSKGSIFQPAVFLVYQRVGSTISRSNGSAFPSQPFRIHNSLKMEVVSSGADEDLEEDSSWSPGVPQALFRLQRTKLRCKKKVDLSFFQKDKLVCVCFFNCTFGMIMLKSSLFKPRWWISVKHCILWVISRKKFEVRGPLIIVKGNHQWFKFGSDHWESWWCFYFHHWLGK